MGTWKIPYDSIERAKRLKRRMAKPWIAKVTFDGGAYMFSFPDSDLIGDDFLYDELGDKADKLKKDFDIRPLVKKILIKWMREIYSAEEITSLQAVNITREVAGLKPLSGDKIIKKNVRAVKKVAVKLKSAGVGRDAFKNYLVKNKFRVNNMHSGIKISGLSDGRLSQLRLTRYAKASDDAVFFTLSIRNKDLKYEIKRLKGLPSTKYKILGARRSLNFGPAYNFIDVVVTAT